jgi:hypothetical protein
MLNSTWNTFKQPVSRAISYSVLAGIITLTSCRTNRGYDPELRMGAEYRFEEGLGKEKHPQYLFDKKTRKDLKEMGYPDGTPNRVPAEAGDAKSARTAPVATTPTKAASDSLRTDTVFKVKPQ